MSVLSSLLDVEEHPATEDTKKSWTPKLIYYTCHYALRFIDFEVQDVENAAR